MSEADLREGLRAAVGEEPPLVFDPDELIRRAEHARRRRRALVAVAVATLALTGTVLSLPGVVDRSGPPGVDAAGPVLTTTASPSSQPSPSLPSLSSPSPAAMPATGLPATTSPSVADPALVASLSAVFSEVVPGSKVVGIEVTRGREERQVGYRTAVVHFIDGFGSSAVVVRLNEPKVVDRAEFCATSRCEKPVRRDDGSLLEFTGVPDVDSKLVTYTVAHFRVDGTVVQVSAYNYDPVGDGATRPEVAVATDQLVRLATDPRLTG